MMTCTDSKVNFLFAYSNFFVAQFVRYLTYLESYFVQSCQKIL